MRNAERFVAPLGAFALLLLGSNCGSASTSAGYDSTSDGGGGGTGSGNDGTSNGNGDGNSSGTDGGSGSGNSPDGGGGGVVTASSGVVITVEPDGTNIAQGLLTAMENATAAVHMEMYLLTSSTYISELIKLAGKGIDVKVILNQTFPSGTPTSETNASTYTQLQSGGVDVKWAPTNTGFDNYTHTKTVIIDPGTSSAQAWVMTMNLDTDAPKYNREYLALDTTAADVTEAEQVFEADYGGTTIKASGNLVVAPSPTDNAQPVLLNLINSATKSIDIEAEEYDSSGLEAAIASALESKAKAGIAVHMVLEDSTDSSQASAVSALQSAGGIVVGYKYTSTGLDIHAKAIVVDGLAAYIGSENLSGGSLGYNRELGVYFTVASEVAKVQGTINQDFAGGSAYSSN